MALVAGMHVKELAIRVMTVMQNEYRLNKKLEMKSYLYDAFLGVMNRPNKDKAMQALLLTIPLGADNG